MDSNCRAKADRIFKTIMFMALIARAEENELAERKSFAGRLKQQFFILLIYG